MQGISVVAESSGGCIEKSGGVASEALKLFVKQLGHDNQTFPAGS